MGGIANSKALLQVSAAGGGRLSAGVDHRRAYPVLLQPRGKADQEPAQGASGSTGGNPSGHGIEPRHQVGRLGLDRDAAGKDPAKGPHHGGHRSARRPRRARLVVPRRAGPGARRVEVQRQRADLQRAAVRSGDGDLSVARVVVPDYSGGGNGPNVASPPRAATARLPGEAET